MNFLSHLNPSDARVAGVIALFAYVTVLSSVGLMLAAAARRSQATRASVLLLALVSVMLGPIALPMANRVPQLRSVANLRDVALAHVVSVFRTPNPEDESQLKRQRGFHESANSSVLFSEMNSETPERDEAFSTTLSAEVSSPQPPQQSNQLKLSVWQTGAPLCLAVWIAGMAWGTVRFIHDGLALRRWAAKTDDITHHLSDWLKEQVKRRLNVDTLPRIVCAPTGQAAFAAGGVIPSVVAIPEDMLAGLEADDLRDVLIHECAHIAQSDPQIGLLQRLAAIVFWPHPFIHLLNRKLSAAREHLCDNFVLRDGDAARFAHLLVELSRPQTHSLPKLGVCHFQPKQFQNRIEHILAPERNLMTRLHPISTSAIAGLFVLVTLATAVVIAENRETSTITRAASEQLRLPKDLWNRPISRKVKRDTLQNAIASLMKQAKINYTIDVETLEEEGVHVPELLSTRIETEFDGLPLGEALGDLFDQHGLTFMEENGAILITALGAPEAEGGLGTVAERRRRAQNHNADRQSRRLSAEHNSCRAVFFVRGGKAIISTFGGVDGDQVTVDDPRNGVVSILSASDGRELAQIITGTTVPLGKENLSVSSDGSLLAVCSQRTGQLSLWGTDVDREQDEPIWQKTFARNDAANRAAFPNHPAFSPDGTELAIGVKDYGRKLNDSKHSIAILSAQKGDELKRIAVRNPAFSLSYSPDGKWLVVSSLQRRKAMLELFETDTWEIKKTIPIGTNRGVHVQFLPDNRHVAIASAGTDGSVGIADMPSGRVHLLGKQSVAAAPGAFGPGGITSFAVSPDGRLIATGGYTNAPTLWLWDTETGESRSLKHPAGRLGVSALAFSPDGREVVSSVVYDDDGKGAHIVWNLSTSYGSAP